MLSWYQGDERPYWQPTITVNGSTDDLSTGFTFAVNIATSDTATPALTKTSNITGSSSGVVTVAWATTDLTMSPGFYLMELVVTRTSDLAQYTVRDNVQILERLG